MWNSRAAAKRISLTLTKEEQPVWVEATEQQLLTIIDNLISNAVKYTQQFGTVRVAIRAVTHDDVPFAELTVTDTGPGIRTEDMGRLFQPWQTLSAVPTGNETSTGLGLYFVKCEVDALGGSVSCDSQVGVGTTFRVKLPVAYDIRSREVA
jgi:signal transduction histidine kinase